MDNDQETLGRLKDSLPILALAFGFYLARPWLAGAWFAGNLPGFLYGLLAAAWFLAPGPEAQWRRLSWSLALALPALFELLQAWGLVAGTADWRDAAAGWLGVAAFVLPGGVTRWKNA